MSVRYGHSGRATSDGSTPPTEQATGKLHAHRWQERGYPLGRHDDGAVVDGVDPELRRQGEQDRGQQADRRHALRGWRRAGGRRRS